MFSLDLRYIDWSEGGLHPKTLNINDYNRLMNSEFIFARKFDTKIDKEVIEKIYDSVKM